MEVEAGERGSEVNGGRTRYNASPHQPLYLKIFKFCTLYIKH